MPRRRYTLLAAAVLSVLNEEDSAWEVKMVAEACGQGYGSVYPVLQRLHGEGLLGRLYIAAPVGHPRLHFDMTPRGKRITEQLLKFMPDPIGALNAWRISEDGEPEPKAKPTRSRVARTKPVAAVRKRQPTKSRTAAKGTAAGARRRSPIKSAGR